MNKLNFGKYKNQKLEDIPFSYLKWLLLNIKSNEELISNVQKELNRRRMEYIDNLLLEEKNEDNDWLDCVEEF